MEKDAAIGFDVDPHSQRKSENEQIEQDATKAEEGTQEPESPHEGTADEQNDAENDGENADDPYNPDARKSVVVPGTDGTLSGTAFSDMVDEDGNLKEEPSEEDKKKQEEVLKQYDEAKEEGDRKREEVEKQADDGQQDNDNPDQSDGTVLNQEPPD